MSNIIATYHKDCIDGTSAAAIVLRAHPEAQLFPLAHNYTAADIAPILALVTPKTICYTLDCALGVQELLQIGATVTTIDHHIGVRDTYQTLADNEPRYTFIFDTEKSGASLAWSYFFPDEAVPTVIKYVEDADLWKGTYGVTTEHICSYLSLFRNDPAHMLTLLLGDTSTFADKGELLTHYANKEIAEQINMEPLYLQAGDYKIPAYNITVYKSACGNILSEKHNTAVALYTIKGSEVTISFRSKDGHEPTALQAASVFGGSGHHHASGARVPFERYIKLLTT